MKRHRLNLIRISCLLLSLVLLEVGIRLLGWSLNTSTPPRDLGNEKTVRILTLGESTTAEVDARGAKAWPTLVEYVLKNRGIDARIWNAARTGITTYAMTEELDDQIQRWKPHFVVSMMGVNDTRTLLSPVVHSENFWQSLRVVRLFHAFKLSFQPPTTVGPIADSFKFKNLGTVLAKLRDQELSRIPEVELNLQKLSSDVERAQYLFYLYLRIAPKLPNEPIPENVFALLRKSLGYYYAVENAPSLMMRWLGLANRTEECLDFVKEHVKRVHELKDPNLNNAMVCYSRSRSKEDWNDLLDDQGIEIHSRNVSTYDSPTARHYRYIADTLKREGITFLAMQYPRLDVEGLKNYFRKNEQLDVPPEYSQVIFLSNAANFEEALTKHKWNEIFNDIFAGTPEKPFGHTTQLGHDLIAQTALDGLMSHLDDKAGGSTLGSNPER